MNTPLEASYGGHIFELWMTRLVGNTVIAAKGVARNFLAVKTIGNHPERLERFTVRFACFDARAAAQAVNTTLRHFDGLQGALPKLKAPTTIMFGAEDKLYPGQESVAVARAASKAMVVVVSDCGHFIPLEALRPLSTLLLDLQHANAGGAQN